MARKNIDIGIVGNDGTGDSIREAFRKVNDNFKEMYAVFGQDGAIKFQDLDNVITEVRQIYPLSTATGLMKGIVIPVDGSTSFNINITASDSITDQFTTVNTISLKINDKITFSSNVTGGGGSIFGGVNSTTTYYINSIISNTKFTISLTQDGLGINRVITSDSTGLNVKPRIMEGGTGISVDSSTDPERIIISSTGGRLITDGKPSLQSPLNANGKIIANVGMPTASNVQTFNNLFGNDGVSITVNDVVISKGYADKNYIRKTGGGGSGQIRARSEPLNRNEYTITIDEYINGNAIIPNHGFDSSIDGSPYTYNSTATVASGLKNEILVTDVYFTSNRTFKITELGNTDFTALGAQRNQLGEVFISNGTGTGTGKVRPVYYIRYFDGNSLSLHFTANDALNNANRIVLSNNDGTAVETLTDAYLNTNLLGNWASSEVLPRNSVVRRQGDIMTGPLTLFDHPEPFEGIGTPNGFSDLQAATKYYVDNSSFVSRVNLFVSTSGQDVQPNTPPGKEGSSWAYSYASISKACQKAEYLLSIADVETGPYRQLIAYNNGASLSVVTEYTPGNIAIVKFSNKGSNQVDQGEPGNEDITPGKLLVGRLSGAKGIINRYLGLDNTNPNQDIVELINVRGTFIQGENLEFGDTVKNMHVTIHVESGIYEEDYPIKLPANTAIVGDEFRRVLVRPRDRISQSPWVDTWFFRNTTFDNLNIVNTANPVAKKHFVDLDLKGWYSHHYYKKPGLPLNPGPKYTNDGGYTTAAQLIASNKTNIAQDIVIYINGLLTSQTPAKPVLTAIEETKSIRDTGFIIDAIVADLIEGGNEKIVNLQEVFSQVSTLNTECKQGIQHISTYINGSAWFATRPTGEKTLITNMINRLYFGFDPAYNTPKNNKDMDVFLCNDASIVRQITCQGHGGFMMVLDPAGQILTKSPYCQQSGSFSGSVNKHSFRGGQYIDGFSGNLKPTIVSKTSDGFVITDIPREPEIPTSFYLNGARFKVNSWLPGPSAKLNAGKLMTLNKNFVKAQSKAHLDTYNVKFDDSEFELYINLLIDSLIFDVINVGNIKTTLAARRLFRLDELTLRAPANQKPLLIGVINHIRDTFITVVGNDPVITNQTQYQQIIDNSITAESLTANAITTLCYNLTNVVQNGIELADNLNYPQFILKLAPNPAFASINPTTITLITPGNTSMLSNDYTQVNDLGYGIVTNNKGLAECVSVFSYYCYTSMYSKNGGQIRSLNSSSANGVYGLIAEAGDPLEVPDDVYLSDNSVQVARVIKSGLYVNSGQENDLNFYIDNYQYLPYNVSIIEIDHGGQIGLTRYIMSNVTLIPNSPVIRINLNTASDNEGKATSLKAALVDNQNIIIRSGQNFKVYNVIETNPTRPSTALTFEGDPDITNSPTYRVIAYNQVGPDGLPLNPTNTEGLAILTTDTTYDYIVLQVDPTRINLPDTSDPLYPNRKLGSQAGDIKIAIDKNETTKDILRLNTGQMITAWDGKMHRVVSYADATDANGGYGIVTLANLATPININASPVANGIQSPLTTTVTNGRIKLRAGLTAGEKANITVRISTLRATGHDFLDIGSGGYNDSNYPSKIFGSPRNLPSQGNEVEERGTGRVFYVSTDQNGYFRVGRFFTVDQGTGTVTFAASIALSDLDGLGFKQGSEINEFSNDDKFVDRSDRAVPTERAVLNYIGYRLGLTYNNVAIDPVDRVGPGFLPLNGQISPINNISWAGYKITNLGNPTDSNDATNKGYVDGLATSFDSLAKKVDVITNTASIGDVLVSFGNVRASVPVRGFSHATVTGDIETELTSTATSTLAIAIPSSGSINDIVLANGASFPSSGYVLVRTTNNEEVFYYSNKQSANILPNVIRLSEQTSINTKFNAGFPSAHAIGVQVISLNTLQLNNQIRPDTIINGDVKSDAGILQSKLSMNEANTFPSADWARTDKAQADLGLAKFDGTEFETDRGFVRLKDTGIGLPKLKTQATSTVVGNYNKTLTQTPSAIPISNVFKRGMFESVRGQISSNAKTYAWSMQNISDELDSNGAHNQGAIEITTNAVANTIVQRNGDGRTQFNGIETDGGVPILTFSGTEPTATPVVYKGQWTPGTDASLHATSADYLTSVDNTVVRTTTNQTISGIKQFSGGIAATNNTYNFGDGASTGSLYFTKATNTYGLTKDGGSGDVVTFTPSGITIDGASTLPKAINATDKFLRCDGTWAVVGTLSSNLVLNTREITTGDAATTGTVTGDWTLTTGSKWQATYADLAEYYTADKNYEPGTVLIFGGTAETTTTTIFGDSRVAGVVTTDPAYVMNAGLKDKPNSTCLALQGRVPCKVVGKVSKGDLLTTSANPGYAIRATNPTVGTIIGKALENKDSFELGVIEIAVGRM